MENEVLVGHVRQFYTKIRNQFGKNSTEWI